MKKLLVLCGLFLLLNTFAIADPVPFTLKNRSLRAIPLEIPGVMNPNLSLFSNSGVSLAVDQKIYFFHKGERYLLLTVTGDLEGKDVRVDKLIKQRKKELDL